MGLGDHIICNGLVRELQKKYREKVGVFSKKINAPSVKFMYRDNHNIEVISVDNDMDVNRYCNNYNIKPIRIGHENLNKFMSGYNWSESFYKQMGVDFSKRWGSFFVKRDVELETKLYNLKNLNKEKYALIHSTSSNGMGKIDYSFVGSNLFKIEVVKETNTIFDYITLILNATEIHCIDSSFIHLVDSFNLNSKLFYHKTINYRGWTSEYQLKNKWKIL